jgi:hypothetical protein
MSEYEGMFRKVLSHVAENKYFENVLEQSFRDSVIPDIKPVINATMADVVGNGCKNVAIKLSKTLKTLTGQQLTKICDTHKSCVETKIQI